MGLRVGDEFSGTKEFAPGSDNYRRLPCNFAIKLDPLRVVGMKVKNLGYVSKVVCGRFSEVLKHPCNSGVRIRVEIAQREFFAVNIGSQLPLGRSLEAFVSLQSSDERLPHNDDGPYADQNRRNTREGANPVGKAAAVVLIAVCWAFVCGRISGSLGASRARFYGGLVALAGGFLGIVWFTLA